MHLRLTFTMALLQAADYITTMTGRMLGAIETNPFLRDLSGRPDMYLVALTKLGAVLLFMLLVRNYRQRVALLLCFLMVVVVTQNLLALYGVMRLY